MESDRPDGRERRPVLVSACLLGCTCRYDGRDNLDRALERELEARGERAIPVCPEEEGGLGTPRPAAWLTNAHAGGAAGVLDGVERVVTVDGADVTDAFARGAEIARARCDEHGITRAYLKERSPSCGVRNTHAGGELVDGPGVTAARLMRAGVEVVGVDGRRA